jgi:uncharacterized repeat protein (TIGR01451 family)
MTMLRAISLLLIGTPALAAQAVTVTIQVLESPICIYSNGTLRANASGGVGPYSYLWSNGATTQTIFEVEAGSYSVTVTDFLGDEATAQLDVLPANYALESYLSAPGLGLCQPDAWLGFQANEPLGPEPYYVNGQQLWETTFEEIWGSTSDYFIYNFTPAPYGSLHTFPFQDGNGCTGTFSAWAGWPVEWPQVTVDNIQGACEGTTSGSVTLSFTSESNYQSVQVELIPEPVGMSAYFACGISPTTHTYTGLAPGVYTLRLFMSTSSYLPSSGCDQLLNITIPDLGPTCGFVSGRVFVDNNQNCAQNPGEPGVPGTILEVLPGPYYFTTNAQGQYAGILPLGNYTMEQQSTAFDAHCVSGPIDFELSSATPMVTVNIADTSLAAMDAMVSISSGIARPGFQFGYGVNVRNLMATSTGTTTLTLTLDPALGYLSATPTPTNVSGNTITWQQSSLGAWQQRAYSIVTQVPPDITLLGTELQTTAVLATANTDGNPANNTATNLRIVTGAYDPNDKLAYTSGGNTSVWQIGDDEWIDYTIRFQNTGTDTAFNVLITDTLPLNLDPGTIVIGAASHHPFTWELRDAGTLKFYFPNILLPDSNINEPLSHGFVGFRIRPRLPLLPGDEIENIANIYFDFNPPVITEPSVLVVTTGTGVVDPGTGMHLQLMPNPTDGLLIVRMSGDDIRPGMLRVRGMDGRVVMEQRMTGPEVRMDVQRLANGAYVLEMLNDNGPRSVARLVKQ